MPSDEKEKERLDILLTTYPEHGSRNVGDRLITDSALKLIRRRIPDYNPVMIFREEALERFDKRKVRSILAPGFSINDASYPKLFKLYENLDGVSKLFHPIGCSFQHLVPRKDTYNEYVYSDETLNFLRDGFYFPSHLRRNVSEIIFQNRVRRFAVVENMTFARLTGCRRAAETFERTPHFVRRRRFGIGHYPADDLGRRTLAVLDIKHFITRFVIKITFRRRHKARQASPVAVDADPRRVV